MSFRVVQSKLAQELIPDYHQSVRNSKNLKDLQSAMRFSFNKAVNLLMPDHIIIIKSAKDPQDSMEEHKGEFDLTAELI